MSPSQARSGSLHFTGQDEQERFTVLVSTFSGGSWSAPAPPRGGRGAP